MRIAIRLCPTRFPSTRPVVHRGRFPSQQRFKIIHKAGTHDYSPLKTFERLPLDVRIEEETLPGYKAERYYPVHIGDVYDSRYKTLAKIGYGTGSTVWLCRDLETNEYEVLKICVRTHNPGDLPNEVKIARQIATIDGEHPGRMLLHLPYRHFQVESAQGTHNCLVFKPAGLNLTWLRSWLPGRTFPKLNLQACLHHAAVALDFLRQSDVVHTDISPNNLLLGVGVGDAGVLEDLERAEIETPSSRKVYHDRCIYTSWEMMPTSAPVVMSDFGSAVIGKTHTGDVMPAPYRAPEVILNMKWGFAIDSWALGLLVWDLFEGETLFRAVKDNRFDDELHLAEMVALLGPPPREFLTRSPDCSRYWDAEGRWIAGTPIPDQSLSSRETRLQGQEKEDLLRFVRSVLRWLPEERATGPDLHNADFLMQYYDQKEPNTSTEDKSVEDSPAA